MSTPIPPRFSDVLDQLGITRKKGAIPSGVLVQVDDLLSEGDPPRPVDLDVPSLSVWPPFGPGDDADESPIWAPIVWYAPFHDWDDDSWGIHLNVPAYLAVVGLRAEILDTPIQDVAPLLWALAVAQAHHNHLTEATLTRIEGELKTRIHAANAHNPTLHHGLASAWAVRVLDRLEGGGQRWNALRHLLVQEWWTVADPTRRDTSAVRYIAPDTFRFGELRLVNGALHVKSPGHVALSDDWRPSVSPWRMDLVNVPLRLWTTPPARRVLAGLLGSSLRTLGATVDRWSAEDQLVAPLPLLHDPGHRERRWVSELSVHEATVREPGVVDIDPLSVALGNSDRRRVAPTRINRVLPDGEGLIAIDDAGIAYESPDRVSHDFVPRTPPRRGWSA